MASTAHGARGQTLPLVVFFMFSLIGVVGVAIDVGSWYQSKQSLQAAADAAALAGASQILASWSAANAVAEERPTGSGHSPTGSTRSTATLTRPRRGAQGSC